MRVIFVELEALNFDPPDRGVLTSLRPPLDDLTVGFNTHDALEGRQITWRLNSGDASNILAAVRRRSATAFARPVSMGVLRQGRTARRPNA
jgi:hypothetical protein